jgi:hypothetical protein
METPLEDCGVFFIFLFINLNLHHNRILHLDNL